MRAAIRRGAHGSIVSVAKAHVLYPKFVEGGRQRSGGVHGLTTLNAYSLNVYTNRTNSFAETASHARAQLPETQLLAYLDRVNRIIDIDQNLPGFLPVVFQHLADVNTIGAFAF
jgi:hypothetical protein